MTFGLTLQAVQRSGEEASLERSVAATPQPRPTDTQLGQHDLSDTQAALKHAMQQLEKLTESNNEMKELHEKLEQQSQAIHSMQDRFKAVEAEKAQEHEQTISRYGRPDTDCELKLHQVRHAHSSRLKAVY